MCLYSPKPNQTWSNFLCTDSIFPHPPSAVTHLFLRGTASSALCSYLRAFSVRTRPENTPCPSDAQFNLFSARLMYVQRCVQTLPVSCSAKETFASCVTEDCYFQVPHPAPRRLPRHIQAVFYLAPWSHPRVCLMAHKKTLTLSGLDCNVFTKGVHRDLS